MIPESQDPKIFAVAPKFSLTAIHNWLGGTELGAYNRGGSPMAWLAPLHPLGHILSPITLGFGS